MATTREYVRAFRPVIVDGHQMHVHAYSIISTDLVVFDVLEPGGRGSTHTCSSHHDGVLYGHVKSRRLPADIDAIPFGPERVVEVRRYHLRMQGVCERAIVDAFPELKHLLRLNHGEATCALSDYHRAVKEGVPA